jgi:hypothetical protein
MPPPDSHAMWVEQMLRAELPRLLVLAILLLAHTLGVHQGEAARLLPLAVDVCSDGLWLHSHVVLHHPTPSMSLPPVGRRQT